jgi:hypothetical protein
MAVSATRIQRTTIRGFACVGRRATCDDFADDRRPTTDDGLLQIRHLHRRQCRFESLISHLQSGAVDRLLQRFARENTEGMWHARLLRRLPDPARDFVDDHVVMGGISAKQAAEADDGVIFLGFRQRARSGWDFERAGDADDFDGVFFSSGTEQPVVGTSKESVRDELVKARGDNTEPKAVRAQMSGKRLPPNLLFGAFPCVSVSLW